MNRPRRTAIALLPNLLATIAGGVVAGVLAIPSRPDVASAAVRPRHRPNVLWFIADDPSPYLGAYGDPVARTPTIDRLAAEGIRFDVVYSDAPVCAPSRFALITGLYSATAGPAHHMRAIARLPAFVHGWPELLRRAGYYTVNNSKTDYNADIDVEATWDESSTRAHWRNRPDGTPFFAQFTTLTTHESSIFFDRPGPTPVDAVRIPPFYPDTPTTRTDKAQYYDRVAQMDDELAQRLAELEAAGLADDTIVFFFSDNGGVLPWSKRFANDRGLRVPLIVRIPEKWRHLAPGPPGSVIDAPINFADFPPTVLSLTGVKIPDYMQGTPFLGRSRRRKSYAWGQRSRMDERYDLQRTVRDTRYLYVRNYMPHRAYGQHVAFMWNQPGYREWELLRLEGRLTPLQERFWREKPSEELYDLRTDPDQLDNVARDPGRRRVLRRLRQALDKHMLKIKDNGFIPEGSTLEGYEQSRARAGYPLRRVMRIAQRAIERDPKNLDTLSASLRDANEVVRYWAVQGLIMLSDAGRPAAAALEERLDGDPSIHVRVAAAEALARLSEAGRPLAFLAETLDTHEDRRVRLLALNALTDLPVAALKPYEDVIERAAISHDEYIANAGRYLLAVVSGTYDPRMPP
jgi:arylsulfatase A-like enzyme